MKKIFDFALQCAICNYTTETYVVMEPWQVGDECPVICHRCSPDDEESAIVTWIDTDQVLEGKEELAEWYENVRYHANTEEVAHLLLGEVPEGIVVETMTAWAVPKSRYPVRDWVTVREASELTGVPRKTILTWIERGKLFEMQTQGWIQNAGGSTLLLHRKVVEMIKEMKKEN